MHVTIDGVEYAPISNKIGIAITTHNRAELLSKALQNQLDHLPPDAVVVVVDDGSEKPVSVPGGVKLIRHDKAKGIAGAKNACLSALMDAGCDHLFLFDDDTWPTSADWWEPYVESRQPHLMYIWGDDVVFEDAGIVGHQRPKGCMLYVERKVVDAVGGMDPRFGAWGFEHESWSDRIHNAGYTTCRYQDVSGSRGLFFASDEKGCIESSVPEHVRINAKPQLAEEKRHSDEYIPYRGVVAHDEAPQVALSILIPSVHTRWKTFGHKIQEQIFGQHARLSADDQARVEVLIMTDTKTINLGTKRNEMVRLAKGEYVAFVDDDDRLEPSYLADLLKATESGADVITFHVRVSLDGGPPKLCRYSLKHERDESTATEYKRLPNHICAVKRSIALRTPFPEKLCGEDKDYARDLRPLLKTEHAIDKVLYHYDYSTATTETQLTQRYQREIIKRSKKPTVDVVILSKASTNELRAMTQHTIDTCLAGAGDHVVNIVVVEQIADVHYRGAFTIYEHGKFMYNAFCNHAARTGSAPWIVFANNDLEFEDGWLDALLVANHPLVSPANPGDIRQNGISRNEVGDTNGRHFCGWCFMMKRDLWKRIGGLDEDFDFWCADDCVIEQAKRVNVKPMIVPAARVKHLTSKTGGNNLPDEMTWGMVRKFEEKYGVKKFDNDPRYIAYKKRSGMSG